MRCTYDVCGVVLRELRVRLGVHVGVHGVGVVWCWASCARLPIAGFAGTALYDIANIATRSKACSDGSIDGSSDGDGDGDGDTASGGDGGWVDDVHEVHEFVGMDDLSILSLCPRLDYDAPLQ